MMWSMLICNCWTRLLFGYQEIGTKEWKWLFFFFTKNLLEIKKLFENIKNKFWLIKNILRKLKEKNKGGKKLVKKRKIF